MKADPRYRPAWHWMVIFTLLAWLATGNDAMSAGETTRIVVISDINGRYGSVAYHPRLSTAISRIISLQPDIVISTGDMVAGQRPSPKLKRSELEAMWARFHRDIRTPLEQAGIPVLMTPGNHDASAYPAYRLERQVYSEYHHAHPAAIEPAEGGNFPFHYQAQVGEISLISLDATQPGAFPKPQLSWLSQALQPEKSTIVFGHLPLQPIAIGRERDVIRDAALEQLLAAHGNLTYLSGHHHAYYPGQRLGVTMLGMGNLGGNQRRLIGTSVRTGFSFALLEYEDGELVRLAAFVGPDFSRPLDHASLPTTIGTGAEQLHLLESSD